MESGPSKSPRVSTKKPVCEPIDAIYPTHLEQNVTEITFPFVISYNDNFIFLDDVRHPEDDLVAIEKKEGRAGEFSTGEYEHEALFIFIFICLIVLASVKNFLYFFNTYLNFSRNVQSATYSNIFDAYFILGIIAIEGISYLICVTERMKIAEIGIVYLFLLLLFMQ
jgi:hypothetical protein